MIFSNFLKIMIKYRNKKIKFSFLKTMVMDPKNWHDKPRGFGELTKYNQITTINNTSQRI